MYNSLIKINLYYSFLFLNSLTNPLFFLFFLFTGKFFFSSLHFKFHLKSFTRFKDYWCQMCMRMLGSNSGNFICGCCFNFSLTLNTTQTPLFLKPQMSNKYKILAKKETSTYVELIKTGNRCLHIINIWNSEKKTKIEIHVQFH